jgi:hypothetical protein
LTPDIPLTTFEIGNPPVFVPPMLLREDYSLANAVSASLPDIGALLDRLWPEGCFDCKAFQHSGSESGDVRAQ